MSPRRAKAVRGRVGEDPATALREHLIEAAVRLLGERPFASITTRDIARAAEVSDGVLYNYFADKNELLMAAMIRRFGTMVSTFQAELPHPGTGTVEGNLRKLARAALDLFATALPFTGGLVTEPALLHRFLFEIHHQPDSPQQFQHHVVEYMAAEKKLGRLGAVDPAAVVNLLTGGCLVLALSGIFRNRSHAELMAEVPGLVHTLLHGAQPPAVKEVADRLIDR